MLVTHDYTYTSTVRHFCSWHLLALLYQNFQIDEESLTKKVGKIILKKELETSRGKRALSCCYRKELRMMARHRCDCTWPLVAEKNAIDQKWLEVT